MAQAAMAAGGIVGAFGSIMQGQAGKQAGDMNAQMAEEDALQSISQAAEEERKLRMMGRKHLGEMRAGYGASGIQMEGSALEVLQESAAQVELDALNIKYMGEQRARSYRNEARLHRFQGAQAEFAGYVGAASSLLTAGGNMYGSKASAPKRGA